jgi:hypothetical protein
MFSCDMFDLNKRDETIRLMHQDHSWFRSLIIYFRRYSNQKSLDITPTLSYKLLPDLWVECCYDFDVRINSDLLDKC